MPVLGMRVVDAKPHAMARSIKRIEGTDRALEQRKPVVVFGSYDNVPHSRILRQAHNGVGVKAYRIELLCQFGILGHRNLGLVHDPLAVTGHLPPFPFSSRNGKRPKVNEHPKAAVTPPCHAGIALPAGFSDGGFKEIIGGG